MQYHQKCVTITLPPLMCHYYSYLPLLPFLMIQIIHIYSHFFETIDPLCIFVQRERGVRLTALLHPPDRLSISRPDLILSQPTTNFDRLPHNPIPPDPFSYFPSDSYLTTFCLYSQFHHKTPTTPLTHNQHHGFQGKGLPRLLRWSRHLHHSQMAPRPEL